MKMDFGLSLQNIYGNCLDEPYYVCNRFHRDFPASLIILFNSDP